MFLSSLITILLLATAEPPEGSVPTGEPATPACCEPGASRAQALLASVTQEKAAPPRVPEVERILDLVDKQSMVVV